MKNKRITAFILILILISFFYRGNTPGQEVLLGSLDSLEEESYTSKEEVSGYLLTYNELPPNFIRKKEAQELGWVAAQGNLWELAPGKSIGGDRFYNREGLLPEKKGRLWYECDIDYSGGRRTAKRLVFSSDGLIYYTEDHYRSFTEIKYE
ncbi:MAG TPA: ribonuclease domain-containing protein [Clostridia bacterium]|nr:ribonuclease domain-containing protein [Clostridia bacterium]